MLMEQLAFNILFRMIVGAREATEAAERPEGLVLPMREERERQRAEAHEESREQLLEIVEEWSLARRIEAFFDDALRRSRELDAEHRTVIADRLTKARAMVGGLDALARFRQWQTPEELLAPEQST